MSVSVSAIIPVYNGESFLQDAIESILQQTHQVSEIIIIDDGSKDKSFDIAISISKSSSVPIRVFRQQNSGVSVARNLGLLKSSGDLVAFLDVDDIWKPTKIEKQLALYDELKNHEAFIFTDYYLDDENDTCRALAGYTDYNVCTQTNFSKEDFQLAFIRRNFVGTASTVIFNRELAMKIGGFNHRLNHSEDFDFILRYSQHGCVYVITDPLAVKRSHGANLSGDLKLHFWSHYIALKSNIDLSSSFTRFNYRGDVEYEMMLSHDTYLVRFCNQVYEISIKNGLKEYFQAILKIKTLRGFKVFLKAFTRKVIRTASFGVIKRS